MAGEVRAIYVRNKEYLFSSKCARIGDRIIRSIPVDDLEKCTIEEIKKIYLKQ